MKVRGQREKFGPKYSRVTIDPLRMLRLAAAVALLAAVGPVRADVIVFRIGAVIPLTGPDAASMADVARGE